MKNLYTFLVTLFVFTFSNAQIVDIPDPNFKDALLNHIFVIDTNEDGEIQVSEAEIVEELYITNKNIYSLEGIQSFTNLKNLYCGANNMTELDLSYNVNLEILSCQNNQLNSIDISQSPNLKKIHCFENQITNLDVSNNSIIIEISCFENQLTSLDVTQNPLLESLSISHNQISTIDLSQNFNLISFGCLYTNLVSLDLSQNTNLTYLSCYYNSLTSLNVKNGNNLNMVNMLAYENPNLTCIQVDDENAIYPECIGQNGWCKDESAIYSEDCTLGIEDNTINSFSIYPNPTKGVLYIESQQQIETVKIYSLQGQLIKESSNSKIDVSQLTTGLYFIQVTIEGIIITKKFIKE